MLQPKFGADEKVAENTNLPGLSLKLAFDSVTLVSCSLSAFSSFPSFRYGGNTELIVSAQIGSRADTEETGSTESLYNISVKQPEVCYPSRLIAIWLFFHRIFIIKDLIDSKFNSSGSSNCQGQNLYVQPPAICSNS